MDTIPQVTVISLHGIRTRGQWQKDLQAALEDGGFKHRALDFGFFRAISLVNPWAREKKVKWFLEEFTQIRATAKGPISIIAHSFGSYIVAAAMRKYRQIEFERIILCGSIVPVNYDWSALILKRNQAKEVLNQYGKQDVWVRVAEWAVPDAGPSGYIGFKDDANGMVVQQEFTDYSHSEYFFDLNFRDNWIPFLQAQGVQPQYNLKDAGTNWKFRALLTALFFSVLLAAFALYFSGMFKPAPSQVSSTGSTVDLPTGGNPAPPNPGPPDPDTPKPMPKPEPEPPTPNPPKPTWTDAVFRKVEGEWVARNTYPAVYPPAATHCAVVKSYESRMTFSEDASDAIRGSYEMHETHTVSAAIPDANAPAVCNQLFTGNPSTSEFRIDRKASISLMALNGSPSDLILKTEFYECKIQGVSNCPPSEFGTYPNISIRVSGDFDRIMVNDMNFGKAPDDD